MADDNFKFTRRKVLGAVGAAGTGGALGGAGTMALFSDEENTTGNAITAGKLDLEIDWTEHYNGEQIEREGLSNDPGPIFQLDDVKPGDYGEATISLHVFHNPAFVHLAGELTSNDDNGLEEPETSADPTGGSGDGELADEIEARIWYDGTEERKNGGNNEFDDGEQIIASGTLREVLKELANGRLLENQVSDRESGVDFSSNGIEVTTTFCGEFQSGGGGQAQQCIDCLPCDNPEVLTTPSGLRGTCYEPSSIPSGATHVALKAARGCYVAELTDSTTRICLPTTPSEKPNDPSLYGDISNATFYRCPTNGDGDNGNGGDGGECFPNSTTQYVGLSWELPEEVGNEVQGDSVEFDLEFHAQQCRHNEEPANPYADT